MPALGWNAGAAWAQPAGDIRFDIPPQRLGDALVRFAVQAGVSIGHAGIDFAGAAAPAVEGLLAPRDALALLLAGSGYTYDMPDTQTVLIRLARRAGPALLSTPIERVVVTATKRPAVAQSLPISVVSVAGGELGEAGGTLANTLAGHVAAVSATNLGAGQDKLFIRGLSDSVVTGRTQSTVGLYLDEQRVTDDTPDPGLRLVDVERVEVLRGPQGTLYGAGTLGGLIRVVTNRPVLDRVEATLATSASVSVSGGPSASTDAMVNLPLLPGVLGLRAVGYLVHDGGTIDDTRLGRRDANHTGTGGGRMALRWRPDQDWNVTLNVTGQTIHAADAQYSQAGLAPYENAKYEREPRNDAFLQASVTAEHWMPWGKLTSTTGVTERRIFTQYDATLEWHDLTGYPTAPSIFADRRQVHSITHESRINSVAGGRWAWLAGVFGTQRYEGYRFRIDGEQPGGLPVLARSEQRDDSAHEAALFGETTYRVTPWLALTGGARVFYSELSAAAGLRDAGASVTSISRGSNHAVSATGKFIVSVRPRRDLMVYASVADGYRLGGINIDSPAGAVNVNAPPTEDNTSGSRGFAPDKLFTYELGAKTSFWNGRLVANAATYLTQWRNVQSDQILHDGTLYIANIGSARDPGFETDVALRATPRLLLQAHLFWNDPEIVHANPFLIQKSGTLPGVPNNSFGGSARYDLPLSAGYAAFASADAAYTGRSRVGLDAINSPPMGQYVQVNMHLGVARERWRAVLYIDNLTNDKTNTLAYGNPFSFGRIGQVTPLRPLTVGIGLSLVY